MHDFIHKTGKIDLHKIIIISRNDKRIQLYYMFEGFYPKIAI